VKVIFRQRFTFCHVHRSIQKFADCWYIGKKYLKIFEFQKYLKSPFSFSAYWIAHKAVKTVFDDIDGLDPSPYSIHNVWEVIREHFNADTRADILPHAYKHFDKPKFAGKTSTI
jgi:hypothetical protein